MDGSFFSRYKHARTWMVTLPIARSARNLSDNPICPWTVLAQCVRIDVWNDSHNDFSNDLQKLSTFVNGKDELLYGIPLAAPRSVIKFSPTVSTVYPFNTKMMITNVIDGTMIIYCMEMQGQNVCISNTGWTPDLVSFNDCVHFIPSSEDINCIQRLDTNTGGFFPIA